MPSSRPSCGPCPPASALCLCPLSTLPHCPSQPRLAVFPMVTSSEALLPHAGRPSQRQHPHVFPGPTSVLASPGLLIGSTIAQPNFWATPLALAPELTEHPVTQCRPVLTSFFTRRDWAVPPTPGSGTWAQYPSSAPASAASTQQDSSGRTPPPFLHAPAPCSLFSRLHRVAFTVPVASTCPFKAIQAFMSMQF